MKTKLFNTISLYVIILLISIFTLNLNAKETQKEKIERLAENCFSSLTHNNQGVVESAIFVSLQFKNKFPKVDANEFIEVLDEIASESKSAKISYKAQLAKMYFKNSQWFKNINVNSIKEEQKVYENIAETLNNILFVTDSLVETI